MSIRQKRMGGLVFLGVVRGLVSDGEAVYRKVTSLRPEAVLVSISHEELDGLRELEKKKVEPPVTNHDDIYASRLSEYGDVSLPPPCFTRAVDACKELNIPLHPLDMPEKEFSDLYFEKITMGPLLRYSITLRALRRKRFDCTTPEEFAVAWSGEICRIPEFQELEAAREKYMAQALHEHSERYESMVVVVEIERMKGLIRRYSTLSGS